MYDMEKCISCVHCFTIIQINNQNQYHLQKNICNHMPRGETNPNNTWGSATLVQKSEPYFVLEILSDHANCSVPRGVHSLDPNLAAPIADLEAWPEITWVSMKTWRHAIRKNEIKGFWFKEHQEKHCSKIKSFEILKKSWAILTSPKIT